MEKQLQTSEDIRQALVREINRKEKQLRGLKETLAGLEAAMNAAAQAYAASLAATERSVAALANNAAETERASVQTKIAAPAPPPPVAKPAPKPVLPPQPVVEEIEPEPVTTVETAAPQPISGGTPVAQPTGSDWPTLGRYATMKTWKAIQIILTQARASLTLEEIARELQNGGADLGESPLRTVSTAVGYMSDKIFHVSKNGGRTVVSVISPSNR